MVTPGLNIDVLGSIALLYSFCMEELNIFLGNSMCYNVGEGYVIFGTWLSAPSQYFQYLLFLNMKCVEEVSHPWPNPLQNQLQTCRKFL